MTIVFFRTLVLYVLIVISLRIMGKRQLGELQPSEFVVTILISNIATLPIEDTNIPLIGGVVPILVLVSLEVLTSALALKNYKVRRWVSGRPRIIIRDGVIDQKEMEKLRFSIDDLMEELRSNSIFDVKEVSFAIVETTGKVSIYQPFDNRPATASMVGAQPAPSDNLPPPSVIVSDGVLVDEALHDLQVKKDWLPKLLKKEKCDIKDIFLLTAQNDGSYNLILREKGRS